MALEQAEEMSANQFNVLKTLVNMEDCVYRWVMEFSVSVQLDFQDDDVRLTLMNVLRSRVITEQRVLIFRKVIGVSVLLDIPESIAKKNDLIVEMTRVLLERCVRMSLDLITLLVCVVLVILEPIVTSLSIHAQQMEILAITVLLVWLFNKADSCAIVFLDGKARLVKSILTTVLNIHAC
jgi:hypothetical protein